MQHSAHILSFLFLIYLHGGKPRLAAQGSRGENQPADKEKHVVKVLVLVFI